MTGSGVTLRRICSQRPVRIRAFDVSRAGDLDQ